MIAEKAKANQIRGGSEKVCLRSDKAVDTREELSKISGVSQGSIQKVEFINQSGDDIT